MTKQLTPYNPPPFLHYSLPVTTEYSIPPESSKKEQILVVLKLFAEYQYAAFLFLSWFMGFGVGLVFTFLFWHLQVGKTNHPN